LVEGDARDVAGGSTEYTHAPLPGKLPRFFERLFVAYGIVVGQNCMHRAKDTRLRTVETVGKAGGEIVIKPREISCTGFLLFSPRGESLLTLFVPIESDRKQFDARTYAVVVAQCVCADFVNDNTSNHFRGHLSSARSKPYL